MEIAAFIPVYLQAKRAVEIARRLASEAEEGEIILVIDGETTEDIAVALRELGGHPRVRVISGGPHLGKAEALNRAVSTTGADILVFIDNDIEIPAEARILEGSLRVLGENDIAEMPKVGRGKGPLARMVIYEFFSNVIGTQYLVRKTGRFPSMNGAAFTVRRELFDKLGGFRALINEDMDFAARAYFEGARFGFDPEMTVRNEVPESLKTWLRQRKRWSINSSLWSMTYSRRIIAHDAASRKFFLGSALVFPLPTLALLAGTFLPLIPVALLHGDGMASAGAVPRGSDPGLRPRCRQFPSTFEALTIRPSVS